MIAHSVDIVEFCPLFDAWLRGNEIIMFNADVVPEQNLKQAFKGDTDPVCTAERERERERGGEQREKVQMRILSE